MTSSIKQMTKEGHWASQCFEKLQKEEMDIHLQHGTMMAIDKFCPFNNLDCGRNLNALYASVYHPSRSMIIVRETKA
jgi:hypothetical protein